VSIDTSKQQQLWKVCQNFIKDQRISCPETVHQSDRVIENAYDFIARVCEIVGFYEWDD